MTEEQIRRKVYVEILWAFLQSAVSIAVFMAILNYFLIDASEENRK